MLSWPSPRRGSGRRGAGSVQQPRGGLGWCLQSGRRWAVRGTPSRRRVVGPGPGVGQLVRALQPLYGRERGGGLYCAPRLSSRWGRRAAGGRRRPGRREPCVTAETAALGGRGEPVAWCRRGSGVRGEIVLLMLSGNSDRGFGLMSGAGDDRLGRGLGGFPLEEVVGYLKAQSTCF